MDGRELHSIEEAQFALGGNLASQDLRHAPGCQDRSAADLFARALSPRELWKNTGNPCGTHTRSARSAGTLTAALLRHSEKTKQRC
jgi:hypothetical protein